jgi:predicted DNA-binding transcriptional regulator AlpA
MKTKIEFSYEYKAVFEDVARLRYPRPVKVGPGSSRWLKCECEAALRSMVEGRAS